MNFLMGPHPALALLAPMGPIIIKPIPHTLHGLPVPRQQGRLHSAPRGDYHRHNPDVDTHMIALGDIPKCTHRRRISGAVTNQDGPP